MKFEYQEVFGLKDCRGKTVKRPIVWLELESTDGTFEVPAIIDSGADTTVVNLEYAKALGLSFAADKQIAGIGNGRISARVGHLPFKIKHLPGNFDVPAWFVDSENVGILLGQEVFFEIFRIRFEKDHNTFELIAVK